MIQWGNVISSVATPLAGFIGADCYDPVTHDLKPDSRCGQARQGLNNAKSLKDYAEVVYNRFRKQQQTTKENMAEDTKTSEFLIVSVITAEDVVDALAKKNEAKVMSINPKPQAMSGVIRGTPPSVPQQGKVIMQGKAQSQSG